MPVTLDEIMREFSAEDREEINREAARLIAESRTLRELRVALGLTQDQVADALETSQSNLAQIEKKTDVKVSTVAKVVEALGGHLHLVAVLPGQEPVTLRFGDNGITARRVAASVPKVRRSAPARVVAESDPPPLRPAKNVLRSADTGRFAVSEEMGLGRRTGRSTVPKKAPTKGERPTSPKAGPSGRGSRPKG